MFSNAIDKINRFLFLSDNPKSLGYMRALLSAVLLYLSLFRFFNLDQYGAASIVPRDQALQLFPDFFRPMVQFFFWPDEWVMGMQITVTFLLFLAMLGLTNRFFMLLTWVIMQGFISRNYSIIFGADLIGTLFFFYLSFTRCSDSFSIKNNLNHWLCKYDLCKRLFCKDHTPKQNPDIQNLHTQKMQKTEGETVKLQYNLTSNLTSELTNDPNPNKWTGQMSSHVSSLFVRLMQFQVSIIYAYTGFEKLKGNTWWDGTALWTVMVNPQFTNFDFIWLRSFPIVFAIGTFISIIFEVYFPTMMMTRFSKRAWLALGAIFHLMIGILFSLMPFSLIMVSTYLLFLDKEDYNDLKKIKKMFLLIKGSSLKSNN